MRCHRWIQVARGLSVRWHIALWRCVLCIFNFGVDSWWVCLSNFLLEVGNGCFRSQMSAEVHKICLSCLMHFMPFVQVKLDTHAVEQDQGDRGKRHGLFPKPPSYPNYCNEMIITSQLNNHRECGQMLLWFIYESNYLVRISLKTPPSGEVVSMVCQEGKRLTKENVQWPDSKRCRSNPLFVEISDSSIWKCVRVRDTTPHWNGTSYECQLCRVCFGYLSWSGELYRPLNFTGAV